MQTGLYQAIGGMKSLEMQQRIVSNNLARMNVPGGRSEGVAFIVNDPRPENVKAASLSANAPGIESVPVTTSHYTDFRQGPLQTTGEEKHLAIMGEAFFTVREPDGSIAYTRNGEFTRTADGRMTLSDGSELLMEGSLEPVRLPDEAANLLVTKEGLLTYGEQQMGRIAFSSFNNPQSQLSLSPSGNYKAVGDVQPINGLSPRDTVVQGSLERNNTDSISEMVRMIEVLRHYEINQKMVTAQDEATGRLIAATAQN